MLMMLWKLNTFNLALCIFMWLWVIYICVSLVWPTRDITAAWLAWVGEKAINGVSWRVIKLTVLFVLSIQSRILEDILSNVMQKSLYFLPHTSLHRPQDWGLHACIFSPLAGWGHHLIDSSQVRVAVNWLLFIYGWMVNRLHFLVLVRVLMWSINTLLFCTIFQREVMSVDSTKISMRKVFIEWNNILERHP